MNRYQTARMCIAQNERDSFSIPKTVSSVTDILDFFRLRAKIRALKKADDTQLEVTDKTFAVLQNIAKS